jgi:hypothetical protein
MLKTRYGFVNENSKFFLVNDFRLNQPLCNADTHTSEA